MHYNFSKLSVQLQKISKSKTLIGKKFLGLKNHKSLVVLERIILILVICIPNRKNGRLHFSLFNSFNRERKYFIRTYVQLSLFVYIIWHVYIFQRYIE